MKGNSRIRTHSITCCSVEWKTFPIFLLTIFRLFSRFQQEPLKTKWEIILKVVRFFFTFQLLKSKKKLHRSELKCFIEANWNESKKKDILGSLWMFFIWNWADDVWNLILELVKITSLWELCRFYWSFYYLPIVHFYFFSLMER